MDNRVVICRWNSAANERFSTLEWASVDKSALHELGHWAVRPLGSRAERRWHRATVIATFNNWGRSGMAMAAITGLTIGLNRLEHQEKISAVDAGMTHHATVLDILKHFGQLAPGVEVMA